MGRDRSSDRRRVRRICRNMLRASKDFMLRFLDVEVMRRKLLMSLSTRLAGVPRARITASVETEN